MGLGGASLRNPLLVIPASNPDGLFTLVAAGVVSVAGYNIPFLKNGVLYQVTAGKTCKVLAVVFMVDAAGVQFQLLSSTATFAFDAAVAALTAPVYQAGASGRYPVRGILANQYDTLGITHEFSAATWPGIQVNAAGNTCSVMLICKEV